MSANFCHLKYSDYRFNLYCYIHKVSADASFGLLPAFLIELRSLHGTLNRIFYLIHGAGCSNSVHHNQVEVLSNKYSLSFTRSQD